jgi:hypothetical protein
VQKIHEQAIGFPDDRQVIIKLVGKTGQKVALHLQLSFSQGLAFISAHDFFNPAIRFL